MSDARLMRPFADVTALFEDEPRVHGIEALNSRSTPWERLRRSGIRHWSPVRYRQIMGLVRSERTVFHAWK
jgi:hypothetical protein